MVSNVNLPFCQTGEGAIGDLSSSRGGVDDFSEIKFSLHIDMNHDFYQYHWSLAILHFPALQVERERAVVSQLEEQTLQLKVVFLIFLPSFIMI